MDPLVIVVIYLILAAAAFGIAYDEPSGHQSLADWKARLDHYLATGHGDPGPPPISPKVVAVAWGLGWPLVGLAVVILLPVALSWLLWRLAVTATTHVRIHLAYRRLYRETKLTVVEREADRVIAESERIPTPPPPEPPAPPKSIEHDGTYFRRPIRVRDRRSAHQSSR